MPAIGSERKGGDLGIPLLAFIWARAVCESEAAVCLKLSLTKHGSSAAPAVDITAKAPHNVGTRARSKSFCHWLTHSTCILLITPSNLS